MSAFDPLSYENLGISISRALDEQPVVPLTEIKRFHGAGVYALYYTGDFPAYERIALANRENPGTWAIYIGKAEAESHRKGDPDQQNVLDGPKLFNRIQNHRKSIESANNLDVHDFSVRYLVVAPTWVQLAEIIAIRLHHPVWNSLIDGFGNHDPGSGRRNGLRPRWDTLHPGRSWAKLLRERPEPLSVVEEELENYLRMYEPTTPK
ncbi:MULTISPECIES: Eco29kI family restriction endonuclease [Corynebacterium]|uniref:Eco29kI family restriction endonuclease n=1 Tax=Corynebacterium coyleae TaxID=53374 RepID=A0AAP7CD84_9CORY|nr:MULTISPECIES: Eco29kI family restriction endonuclease [Corynebacterium]NJJ04308.1 Eco29kI family restriction endonuclease [Corynebacterium coyleae]PLA37596.1 Eco29kI family restriction endonuclease [Corynebacterium coyleae]